MTPPRLLDFIPDRYRRVSPREVPPGMSRHKPDDADAREAVRRLIDLIQALLPTRPKVTEAIERCMLALVVDEMRQRINDRLQRFTPEEISTVEALTAHLDRQHGEEPAPPDGDEAG